MVTAGIELVVTDLDGTLWETPATVHPAVVDALAEVSQRGYPLMVATGRRPRSSQQGLSKLGVQPPLAAFNGALVVDLATGARLAHHPFPRPTAEVVLDAFDAVGLSPCVFVAHDSIDVFLGPAPSTHPDHLARLAPFSARADDLKDVAARYPIYGFGLLGQDTSLLTHLAKDLTGVAEAAVNEDREHAGAAIMVGPAGISKWSSVEAYCQKNGIDPSAVLALGDGDNDLELLAGAATALVPEDGTPRALELADRIIPRAAVAGWVEVLDLLPPR